MAKYLIQLTKGHCIILFTVVGIVSIIALVGFFKEVEILHLNFNVIA